MEAFNCENRGCSKKSVIHCKICRNLKLSCAIGNYCSVACQKEHLKVHKVWHWFEKFSDALGIVYTHIAWTVAFGLHELHIRNKLSILSPDKTFQIHFFGARSEFEGHIDHTNCCW